MSCLNLEGQRTCTACVLRSKCTRVVAGHGSLTPTYMLVGEAPGADEDRAGIPFVGRAGLLLDQLLERAGISKGSTYITNLVKCRPPSNQLREYPHAVHTCPKLWLDKEIELVDPKVIIVLGATAGGLYFPGTSATELSRISRVLADQGYAVGAFHPAYALRQGKEVEDSIVKSFERAKELVG